MIRGSCWKACAAPVQHGGAGTHLDTTTKPAVDSLSPRRRSGESVGERGFQNSATIRWSEPLSPLVPRGEREQEISAMVVVSRCAPLAGNFVVGLDGRSCIFKRAKILCHSKRFPNTNSAMPVETTPASPAPPSRRRYLIVFFCLFA